MSRKVKTRASEKASALSRAPQTSAQLSRQPAQTQATPVQAYAKTLTSPLNAVAPADILSLQGSVGNRAAQQILGAMLGRASGGPRPVQAKLKLGAAGDQYEREADQMAASVMSAPALSPQQPAVQREMDQEDDNLQKKSEVGAMMTTASHEGFAPGVESAVGRARGGGQTLPDGLRARMEAAFGADFGGVRVHHNAEADGLNRSLEARAFTVGQDLYFRQDEYDPLSRSGQELIAHELTHVVQQSGGSAAIDHPQPKTQEPVVQRKNLAQAGKTGGLTDDNKKFPLVDDGRSVKSYSQTAAATAASKLEALNKAGEMNAVVGKRTEGWWWTEGNVFDNSKANTLDPFFFRASVPFKVGEETKTLSLYFQHALNFTGYVVDIKDTSNEAAQNYVSMYKGKPLKASDKFSNIHDTTDNAKLIDLAAGKDEKNLDAYTKIAGEGARWKCVRKHAANLRNDSLFFTKKPSDATQVWAVTFETLWLSWKKDFKKKYDIPDADVVSAIKKAGTVCDLNTVYKTLAEMRPGVDYDLDNSRSHVAPPAPAPVAPAKK